MIGKSFRALSEKSRTKWETMTENATTSSVEKNVNCILKHHSGSLEVKKGEKLNYR